LPVGPTSSSSPRKPRVTNQYCRPGTSRPLPLAGLTGRRSRSRANSPLPFGRLCLTPIIRPLLKVPFEGSRGRSGGEGPGGEGRGEVRTGPTALLTPRESR
jgi:hypothetical protein